MKKSRRRGIWVEDCSEVVINTDRSRGQRKAVREGDAFLWGPPAPVSSPWPSAQAGEGAGWGLA